MAEFVVNDQVYRTRFWANPGVKRTKRWIRLEIPNSLNIWEITGLRSTGEVFKLRIRPSLPGNDINISYREKDGILDIRYKGELVLSYEYPDGYATIPEKFRPRK